jgi:hypothetical protein
VRPALAAALAAALLAAPPTLGAAREAVDQIAAAYEGRQALLRVDLHQPPLGGAQAPYLDERGWHHNDPARPVALRAGEPVEVTGVFNYGDRGVFLEISRKERWKGGAPRVRVRVRFMASAGPEKPDLQAAQIRALVGRVLG